MSEIISLLDDLPVNQESRSAFYQDMKNISKGSPDQNLQQWAELFQWNDLGQKQKTLPPNSFYNLLLLHDYILGGQNGRRLKVSSGSSSQASETTNEFIQAFIERGGFRFLVTAFTTLKKTGL